MTDITSDCGPFCCMGELLGYLKNWFLVPGGIHEGTFTVDAYGLRELVNGEEAPVPPSFLREGQYFRVIGSVFNDGVFRYGDPLGRYETFEGAVWALAVPPDVIRLSREIDRWQEENGEAAAKGILSESFGGYSYTRASGAASWKTAFRDRLAVWRKI